MTWTCMAHRIHDDRVCGVPTNTGAIIWSDGGRERGNEQRVTIPLCEEHGPTLQRQQVTA